MKTARCVEDTTVLGFHISEEVNMENFDNLQILDDALMCIKKAGLLALNEAYSKTCSLDEAFPIELRIEVLRLARAIDPSFRYGIRQENDYMPCTACGEIVCPEEVHKCEVPCMACGGRHEVERKCYV